MRQDLTRTVLAVMFISLLGAASLWVLSPFLPALAWAAMIVIATWPVLRWLEMRLGGRRSMAIMLMVGALLIVLILPFMLGIGALVERADDIAKLPKLLAGLTLPPPPEWLSSIPFVGQQLAEKWMEFSSAGMGAVSKYLAPYAGQSAHWFVGQMGNLGLLIINAILVVAISAILYASGETAADKVRSFARRLAGARGEDSALLAAKAVRALALGIVMTALIQSIFGGIGLAIASVPYAGVLTALMFVLGVAQIGAGPVLLISTIWLYWQGNIGWAIALLVWTVIVGSMDNVLRPFLIKRGADLPLLLIFAGVVGGLLTFGVIGLFIGPLVLAVTYTLLSAWVQEGNT